MLEYNYVLVLAVLPFFLNLLIGYYVLKRARKEAFSLIGEIICVEKGLIKADLENWLNSETAQKALYQLGGLIGNGAASGLGIQKGSGKFKWQNLVGELATNFISGKLKIPQGIVSPKAILRNKMQDTDDSMT